MKKENFDDIEALFSQDIELPEGLSKENIIHALESMQLSLTIRGEALTLEQFAKLSNLLKKE